LYDDGTGKTKSQSKEDVAAEEAKNSLNKYMHYFTRFDNHFKSIKFAEKTRKEAEKRMEQLQKLKGTGVQAASFLLDAVNAVIRCRRVLQWTYVYGYYLRAPAQDKDRVLFETQQQLLEQFTEGLHGMSEKPLDALLENHMRTDVISYTRLVEKYRDNVIKAILHSYESEKMQLNQ